MGRSTVYNDHLTQDWGLVSDQNKKLVGDFMKYCKANDRSPQTLKQYEEWLKVFFCWNYKENGDKFFIKLRKRDFVYYFGWCRELNMSANRIASLKSVLSSLSSEIEMLYEDEYPNFHNQLRGLEPIHISVVREKTVISNEEIIKMLKSLVDDDMFQEACYLALACASGSRKAELLQMKPEFFCPEKEVFGGYMYCTPPIRAKGRGKQGKNLRKYVIKELFKPFFDKWMEERERLGIKSDYLFVTKKKLGYSPATVSTANSIAEKISNKFGVNYYSHSSRHFFCTYLKRMKLPDDVITQIFGWASADMIQTYSDISEEEILEDFFSGFGKGSEVGK